MSYNIDFSLASSRQIEQALCQRLESIRLSRNITQKQLAEESGVSPKTIARLERGDRVSLNTFIRVLSSMSMAQNLEALLPDPSLQPLKLIKNSITIRHRARPQSKSKTRREWKWGDEKDRK